MSLAAKKIIANITCFKKKLTSSVLLLQIPAFPKKYCLIQASNTTLPKNNYNFSR
jgi:hypothetical protein